MQGTRVDEGGECGMRAWLGGSEASVRARFDGKAVSHATAKIPPSIRVRKSPHHLTSFPSYPPYTHPTPQNPGKMVRSPQPAPPAQPTPTNHPNPQVFIFGTNFDSTRLVSRALQHFYGIGPQLRTTLMARHSIHRMAKVGDMSSKQIDSLAAELGTMTIENDLRRQVVDNVKRLRDMGSYRGRRHAMGLPVRGQRTRTQILTARKLNRVDRREGSGRLGR